MAERSEYVDVAKIKVGEYQTRGVLDDDRIDELVASIGRIGLLVPLLVVVADDAYLVISGHHRLQAVRKLGHEKVLCVIKEQSDPQNREIAIADNLFRTDLSPIETASAIYDLYKNHIMTITEIAKAVHRSYEWVERQFMLLSWPADVQDLVHRGRISVAAAHNLAMIDDETYRGFLLRNADESGCTARVTAAWLQAWRSMASPEQALSAEPAAPGSKVSPAVPQAPCICCNEIKRTDSLSSVLICGACINTLRNAGVGG